jgi:anti-sigma regulatory factor (Ser/Thr protein kinase)
LNVEGHFEAQAESVAEARRLVMSGLDGLPETIVDAAALLTSELATNCVVHAKSRFGVRMERTLDSVRVDVTDQGGGKPAFRWPTASQEHGRGLHLIEAFSDDWGIVPAKSTVGKTVWFQLELRRPAIVD